MITNMNEFVKGVRSLQSDLSGLSNKIDTDDLQSAIDYIHRVVDEVESVNSTIEELESTVDDLVDYLDNSPRIDALQEPTEEQLRDVVELLTAHLIDDNFMEFLSATRKHNRFFWQGLMNCQLVGDYRMQFRIMQYVAEGK